MNRIDLPRCLIPDHCLFFGWSYQYQCYCLLWGPRSRTIIFIGITSVALIDTIPCRWNETEVDLERFVFSSRSEFSGRSGIFISAEIFQFGAKWVFKKCERSSGMDIGNLALCEVCICRVSELHSNRSENFHVRRRQISRHNEISNWSESSCEGSLFSCSQPDRSQSLDPQIEHLIKCDEISPHFLLGKFWGNGHISHNFSKGKWKFPCPLNSQRNLSISLKFLSKNYREILYFLLWKFLIAKRIGHKDFTNRLEAKSTRATNWSKQSSERWPHNNVANYLAVHKNKDSQEKKRAHIESRIL